MYEATQLTCNQVFLSGGRYGKGRQECLIQLPIIVWLVVVFEPYWLHDGLSDFVMAAPEMYVNSKYKP